MLRSVHRREILRIESCIERDLQKGNYDQTNDYKSTWFYFEAMKFIADMLNPCRRKKNNNNKNASSNTDNNGDLELNDINPEGKTKDKSSFTRSKQKLASVINTDDIRPSCSADSAKIYGDESSKRYQNLSIKQEADDIQPHTATITSSFHIQRDSTNLLTAKSLQTVDATLRPDQSYIQLNDESFNSRESLIDEDNVRNAAAVSNVNNVYINDAVAKKQNNDSGDKNKIDFDHFDCNYLVSFLPYMKAMSRFQNLQFRAQVSNLMLSFYSTTDPPETAIVDNPLESRKPNYVLNAVLDIEDPDCHFLISILPDMKSMSWLQNLKFRTKMSALMVDIYSTSAMAVADSDSSRRK